MSSVQTQIEVRQLFDTSAQLRIGSAYAGAWGSLNDGAQANIVCSGKVSHTQQAKPVNENTIFDLASLTKILATTSIFMVLAQRNAIDVDAPLEKYLPDETKAHPHLKNITIRQLLSHTSGLPAWRAYFEELKLKFGHNLPFVTIQQRKEMFYGRVLATQPEDQPGKRMIYSDVGFLILGYLLEKKFAPLTLDKMVKDWVWKPMAMTGFHYRPVQCDAAGAIDLSVVATELCPWRGWLQGQVHDDNAWSMGGIAPHAGVFGSLADLVSWTRALMEEKLVSFQTLQRFFSEVMIAGTPTRRTMGFDMPTADGSGSTASAFSLNSVGHLGFTGTSLWIDLDTGDYACLLTNRVHLSRNDLRIRDVRRNFHTIVRSKP